MFLLCFASDVHRVIPLRGSVHREKEVGARKSGDPFPRLRLEDVGRMGQSGGSRLGLAMASDTCEDPAEKNVEDKHQGKTAGDPSNSGTLLTLSSQLLPHQFSGP